jgi:hypothetical protein
MRPSINTFLGYILIFVGLAALAIIADSGGRVIDVGHELVTTTERLWKIDNQTKENRKAIEQVIKEIEINRELNRRTIMILESRDALVIPQKKK